MEKKFPTKLQVSHELSKLSKSELLDILLDFIGLSLSDLSSSDSFDSVYKEGWVNSSHCLLDICLPDSLKDFLNLPPYKI